MTNVPDDNEMMTSTWRLIQVSPLSFRIERFTAGAWVGHGVVSLDVLAKVYGGRLEEPHDYI